MVIFITINQFSLCRCELISGDRSIESPIVINMINDAQKVLIPYAEPSSTSFHFPFPPAPPCCFFSFLSNKKISASCKREILPFQGAKYDEVYFEGRGRHNLLVRIEIVLPRNVATRRSLHGDFGLGNLILVDPVWKAIVWLSSLRRQQRKRNGTPKKVDFLHAIRDIPPMVEPCAPIWSNHHANSHGIRLTRIWSCSVSFRSLCFDVFAVCIFYEIK